VEEREGDHHREPRDQGADRAPPHGRAARRAGGEPEPGGRDPLRQDRRAGEEARRGEQEAQVDAGRQDPAERGGHRAGDSRRRVAMDRHSRVADARRREGEAFKDGVDPRAPGRGPGRGDRRHIERRAALAFRDTGP